MMNLQKGKRYSSVFSESIRGNLNSMATGEEESVSVKDSCDDGNGLPDGGYWKRTCRNFSKT